MEVCLWSDRDSVWGEEMVGGTLSLCNGQYNAAVATYWDWPNVSLVVHRSCKETDLSVGLRLRFHKSTGLGLGIRC